jgi:histidyl-tRNA synthetase
VAAGGRYDGLVQSLGGPPVPALGFAVGIERVAILLEREEASCEAPVAYLVHSGSGALEEALWVRRGLATAGVYSDIDYELRSIKAQMRSANRRGARCVIIIGGEELAAGVVGLKDLAGGDQETVKRDEIIGRVLQIASEQEKGG